MVEENTGAHGIDMDVATDPKNQFAFAFDPPTEDFAARGLAKHQAAYFKQYDTDEDNPMVREGLLWRVYLRD